MPEEVGHGWQTNELLWHFGQWMADGKLLGVLHVVRMRMAIKWFVTLLVQGTGTKY